MSCTNFWNPKIGTKKTTFNKHASIISNHPQPQQNSVFVDIPRWLSQSELSGLCLFSIWEKRIEENHWLEMEEQKPILFHGLTWFTWKVAPWNRRFLEENPSFVGSMLNFLEVFHIVPENLCPKRKVDKVWKSPIIFQGKARWGVAICARLLYYTTTINLLTDYRKMS